MKGYKAFESGLTTTHGYTFELGVKHYVEGEPRWQKNGFHFCLMPEDTLRYIDAYNNEYNIAEVEGSGTIIEREDEYEEFFNIYVSNELTVNRIVPREEIFNMILNSTPDRIKRLIILSKLNDEEIEAIKNKYPYLEDTINYYQNEEYALTRKLK